MSRALPRLNAHGELSAAVRALPALKIPATGWSAAQYKRAYILLGQVVHSLVNGHKARWSDNDSASASASANAAPPAAQEEDADQDAPLCRIPATVAVPFDEVCARLGLPRVLTAALDLWNWRLRDPAAGARAAKPIVTTAPRGRSLPLPLPLEDLTCISTMTGTKAEVYFHMVVTAMHAVAAERELLQRIIEAPQWVQAAAEGMDERGEGTAAGDAHALAPPAAVVDSACDALARLLLDIGAALGTFRDLFRRVHDLVSMDVFYHVYRPLLGGWWPEGVLFEGVRAAPPAPSGSGSGVLSIDGVSDDGWRVFRSKGPSAGQSTMVLLFDMLLGVSRHHSRTMGEFQEEVLQYLPAPHRERLWQTGHFAAADGLLRAHTECTSKLKALRQYHIGVATKYLVRTKKGTGSSTFRSLLNDAIEGTGGAALCPVVSAGTAKAAKCPLSS